MNLNISVWCDGSCNNASHNKGGYGIVVQQGTNPIVTHFGGSFQNTTSARMEIRAVIESLKLLEGKYFITIYSDNQYVVNALAKGWVFNWEKSNWAGRKNKDLWQELLDLYRNKHQGRVVMKWVKGHNNHPENELADQLASQGANSENIIIDKR